MAAPRRGYRHRQRITLDATHRPPDAWLPSSWATVPRSAYPPPAEIKRVIGSPSSLLGGAFPVPFDRPALFFGADLAAAGLAAGVEFDLIGGIAAAAAAGGAIAGAPLAKPLIGPVPAGYRGVVDGISPFVTDLAGNSAQITPSQLGLTIVWRLRVNGKLATPYDQIDYIVSPWHQLAVRPLLELEQGDQVTATVQCTAAPYNQIGQIGIRIRGRLVPWDNTTGRPKVPLGW